MYAEFSENLVTGNEMIDTHHKELIDRINKLLDSCEQRNDRSFQILPKRHCTALTPASVRAPAAGSPPNDSGASR